MTAGGDNIPFYFYWNDEKYKKKMEENVYKKRRIPVDAYDLNGNFIATYKSIRDAEKETGCHAQEISKCIRGLANYTKGYKFSKHKEPIPETNIKYFERQVNMFDFAGNYLKTFKSCAEAARFVNFGTKKGESLIAHCAKGERASYRGYLWSYTDKPFLFQRRRKTREKAIDMYDLNGNFIKRFESMSLARDEIRPGIKSLSALRKCCLGETKSAYGYKWKYAS